MLINTTQYRDLLPDANKFDEKTKASIRSLKEKVCVVYITDESFGYPQLDCYDTTLSAVEDRDFTYLDKTDTLRDMNVLEDLNGNVITFYNHYPDANKSMSENAIKFISALKKNMAKLKVEYEVDLNSEKRTEYNTVYAQVPTALEETTKIIGTTEDEVEQLVLKNINKHLTPYRVYGTYSTLVSVEFLPKYTIMKNNPVFDLVGYEADLL